jgi:pilus assembly protein CpaB
MPRSISTLTERPGRSLLLLALLFAAVAAVLVFVALRQSNDNGNKETSATGDTAKVVVAAHDIAARTTLKADMLKLADVPKDSVLDGAFSNVDDLDGQITRYPLVSGEQVVSSKVGAQEKGTAGLSFVVPAGMRAFSIKVSEESGVGGLTLPGDLVDVIGIMKRDIVGIDKAVTLVQSVEVLAVAQEAQQPIPAARSTGTPTPSAVSGTLGERPKDAEPNPGARTVTLSVTPEQAQLLALVQAQGDLALTLRSFGDKAPVAPPETNLIPYGAVPQVPSP